MLDNYIAVIQAGGKGTRLRELTEDKIPKPLLNINGKPMIEWQIENIKRYGIREFIVIIGHMGEKIKEYFKDGSALGVHITYIEENEPLGSAGALYYLKDSLICDNMLLVFGDVMFDMDLECMAAFHEKKHAFATLAVHPNAHPYDSDLVVLDEEERVTGFDVKTNHRDYWYKNLVNAGMYMLAKDILSGISEPHRYDLEKDLLIPYLNTGRIYGYHTTEYLKDAGTPQRFHEVCEEQRKGLWKIKNLGNKQKAIFLDRDGTINVYSGLISQESQLELEYKSAEAIKLINSSGYLAIAITNQPVVARGMCEVDDVENIHRKLEVLLGAQGAFLDDLAFCPHHPDRGFPEENVLYKISCTCRKPKTEMIDKMVEKYNIDLSSSFFVGDSTVDIQTGVNAGLKTILVKTGQAGRDKKYNVKPDYEVDNLLEAVKVIVGKKDRRD